MNRSRILIVSDVLNLRISVASVMKNANYQVETAHVTDAGDFLKHKQFDLLLLDIQSVHKDGMKLLFSVRITHPTMKTVVISSVDDINFRAKVMRNGAKDFLLKPVEPSMIVQTCNSLFAVI